MSAVHTNDTILRQRYRLTNIVGQGGMGHVYRAEDLRLPGRLCAIKSLPPDPVATPEMRKQAHRQFLKEASILAQLDHPNLPKVSDFFSEGDHDYLVMDYVPGRDLQQVLEESRASGRLLDEETVLAWSEQIIDALAYLHRQDPPVLHRDIKPSNIKLTPDHRIKLVDFGLVKVLAPEDARTITVVQGKGTIMYTPLEQYGGEGGHTDARTDIYALGATLYTLLTDVPPAHAKARFLNPSSLKSPRSVNPKLTQHVSDAVMWAMEMHPDRRPNSVREFQDMLVGKVKRRTGFPEEALSPGIVNIIRANWVPGIIALGLLIVAIILTFL
jgi:eukaryotic-like serine/threonine-protein kinase